MIKTKRKLISLVFVIIAIAAIYFLGGVNQIGLGATAVNWTYTITRPFKTFFSGLNLSIRNIFSANALYKRNLVLETEINNLNSALIDQKGLEEENALLKSGLQLKNQGAAITEEARVLFSDPEGLSGVILVDKGAISGINEGMIVVWQSKILVGKVVKVFPNYSKIQTMYAPGLKLGAEDFRSKVLGLAESSNDGLFHFNLLPKNADIQLGDLIVTSIENTQAMKGLILGEIAEIVDTGPATNKSAKIRLPFRLTDLNQVLIIKN